MGCDIYNYLIDLSNEEEKFYLKENKGITYSKNKQFSILISSSTCEFLIELQNLLKEFEINIPGHYKSENKKGFEIRSFSKKEIIKFNNYQFKPLCKIEKDNCLCNSTW